jgi:hypothetical protein
MYVTIEAELLDFIETKVSRVCLLAIDSHLSYVFYSPPLSPSAKVG